MRRRWRRRRMRWSRGSCASGYFDLDLHALAAMPHGATREVSCSRLRQLDAILPAALRLDGAPNIAVLIRTLVRKLYHTVQPRSVVENCPIFVTHMKRNIQWNMVWNWKDDEERLCICTELVANFEGLSFCPRVEINGLLPTLGSPNDMSLISQTHFQHWSCSSYNNKQASP